MQEKGCVFEHRVYHLTTLLENPDTYLFLLKTLQEKGCLFFSKKKMQEKGYGLGYRIGTPAYKD